MQHCFYYLTHTKTKQQPKNKEIANQIQLYNNMLTSRLQQIAVGSSAAAAAFAAYHMHAMGGYLSKVQQQHEIPVGSIFEGGDLFELEVPKSYLIMSNNQEKQDTGDGNGNGDGHGNGDTAGVFVRAFYSAPFFTIERSIIDLVINRRWPEVIHEDSSTFEVGTQHAAWTVTERYPTALSMAWGGTRIGGTTNLQIRPSKRVVGDNSQFVILQFGSTLNSSVNPGITYLHYKYSQLLLAQTAQHLKHQEMKNDQQRILSKRTE